MSPVLVVAKLNFTDLPRYRRYQAAFPAVFAGSGGQMLAADEAPTTVAGDPADKIVVMRFPDRQTAEAFLNSPDYVRISEDRDGGAVTHCWIAKVFS